MCNKCRPQNIHLHFPGSIKHCCDCDSNGGGTTPPNGNYIVKPEGGENGDVLVKQDDKVIWVHVSDLFIEPVYSTEISDI